tara:strand:+ start:146 stop:469 length:324 start_codon:yes stop_codon:yes gene_type:complete
VQHYKCASATLLFISMPTQRKRIGFLPTTEVQEIINKICTSENISQSKVTGILVKEAIKARIMKNNSPEIKDESKFSNDNEFYLVKEFLEFKKFKMMLKKAISEEDK